MNNGYKSAVANNVAILYLTLIMNSLSPGSIS